MSADIVLLLQAFADDNIRPTIFSAALRYIVSLSVMHKFAIPSHPIFIYITSSYYTLKTFTSERYIMCNVHSKQCIVFVYKIAL